MPLISSAYNLSIGNKWILVIPFKQIDPSASVDNLTFNLTGINLPEREILAANMPYKGRQFPLPTGVKEDDKIVTVKYMLSSDWHQYRFLNKWYDSLSNDQNAYEGDKLNDVLINTSIYILSEYKQPMFSIDFEGCWLSNIGGLTLNYQTGQRELEHTFRFRYGLMSFNGLE